MNRPTYREIVVKGLGRAFRTSDGSTFTEEWQVRLYADPEATDPIARRAERMRAAYVAAIGRPSTFAPPVEPVSEWVRRAQASRLPVKEYAR